MKRGSRPTGARALELRRVDGLVRSVRPILRVTPIAFLLLGAVGPPGAYAHQDPAGEVVEAEPIVVTIVRDSLRLAEVPAAVSTVDVERTLRARPGLALEEALRGVPGLQIDNRFNDALGERIVIRGFGARAQFGVRGVRVLVDGIPATLPDGQTTLTHVDPASLGHVEVIRGPASALWGNASGGVVGLETRAPDDAPLAVETAALAGGFGLRRYDVTASGVRDAWGYRASAHRVEYGGHREFAASRRVHADGQLRYATGRDRFTMTGGFVDWRADNPGALPDSLRRADPGAAFPFNVRQRTGEDGRDARLGVTWIRRRGPREIDLTGWLIGRTVDNPIPPTIVALDRTAGGIRVTGRGPVSRGRWMVGFDLELQRDERRNHANDAGARGALLLEQDESVTALGGFGRIGWPLADDLTLRAGLRGDRIRFTADDRLVDISDPDDSGSRTLSAASPSAGVVWTPGPVNLYADVSTAFETPTTTELANRPSGAGGFNPALEPQRTVGLEAGARGRIGARVRWEATAYRVRIDDALVPFQVPDAPGRDFFRNAGSAVHRGLEASVRAELGRGVGAGAAWTGLDARFDRFRTDDGSFDGNRVPGIAPGRFHAFVLWEGGEGWFSAVDVRARGRMAVDDANSAFSAGHAVVDLRVERGSIPLGGIALSARAGITNLLDADYDASVTVNGFGGRFFEPGPGRAAYVGVGVIWMGG